MITTESQQKDDLKLLYLLVRINRFSSYRQVKEAYEAVVKKTEKDYAFIFNKKEREVEIRNALNKYITEEMREFEDHALVKQYYAQKDLENELHSRNDFEKQRDEIKRFDEMQKDRKSEDARDKKSERIKEEMTDELKSNQNQKISKTEIKAQDIKGFTAVVLKNGIEYRNAEDKSLAFVDSGARIKIVMSKNEASRHAALKLASENFNDGFVFKGSDEKKRQLAKDCVALNLEDKIKNPELKEFIAQQVKERDLINGRDAAKASVQETVKEDAVSELKSKVEQVNEVSKQEREVEQVSEKISLPEQKKEQITASDSTPENSTVQTNGFVFDTAKLREMDPARTQVQENQKHREQEQEIER
ncbi:MAG: LPD7 domain-containing protein [bacterium]|nr:LPD7 domain-containing protein [bacterium]